MFLFVLLYSVSGGVVCEFLEVAFHLILYVREVYPAMVFERRKKYNVPVQVSGNFCTRKLQEMAIPSSPVSGNSNGERSEEHHV